MAIRTPIIAIVGRPNVGKSTLFNRIVGHRRAVVEDVAGVTRDRNYALVSNYKVPFYVVDTGGFEKDPGSELQQFVAEQAVLAAQEADLVVALFDAQTGFQGGDKDVVDLLRRYDKPILYVVNKCDGAEQAVLVADFYQSGVDRLYDLSALHGRGVNVFVEEMLGQLPNYDALFASVKSLKEREEEVARELAETFKEDGAEEKRSRLKVGKSIESAMERLERDAQSMAEEKTTNPDDIEFAPIFVPGESDLDQSEYERKYGLLPLPKTAARGEGEDELDDPEVEIPLTIDCIRVAIIGRPNVGKSTLLNTITGEQRAVTSSVAGTTTDPIDLQITRDGQDYLIIDTAGLRKKARVSDRVEKYSTLRALNTIGDSDVAVVIIDASAGPTEQDAKIVGLAHDQGKGIVLVVNKWDIIEKDHRTVYGFKEKIEEAFKFSPYAPIVFVSAMTGKRCPKVISAIREVAYERAKRVSTYRLNRVLKSAQKRNSAAYYRGKQIKLFYGAQIEVSPPRFILFFNYPSAVHFSYLRFLKNAIRKEFGFQGTDIKLVTRKKGREG